MAADEEFQRQHLLAQVIANLPRAFLEEVEQRTRLAYLGKFADVKADPATLAEHRLSKLIQDRMFRMEWELAQAAKAHGLIYTAKPLPENTWAYTYVVSGAFGLTQAYVQAVGALPIPAKYREELARAADVPRLPIDDPREIYQSREFYALLAHNPVGRLFNEDDQKLGSIQLCIPSRSMNSWAFNMSVPELLANYPPTTITKAAPDKKRSPIWKKGRERPTGTGQ